MKRTCSKVKMDRYYKDENSQNGNPYKVPGKPGKPCPGHPHKTKKHNNQIVMQSEVLELNLLLVHPSECALCMKKIESKHFPSIINRALFRRYCSSLNYFYTKDIQKILSKQTSSALIQFKEYLYLDINEEFLRRFYRQSEFKDKFTMLWKFHQFSVVQAIIFHEKTYPILMKYNAIKRCRLERAIRRMLEKLSDSQLEKADINLEDYMRDDYIENPHHQESDGRRVSGYIANKILNEEDIRPISIISNSIMFQNNNCSNYIDNTDGVNPLRTFSCSKNKIRSDYSYSSYFNQPGNLEDMLRSRKKSKSVLQMKDVSMRIRESNLGCSGRINSRKTSYQILKAHDSSYYED
jgi:hypothetical protein